MKDNKSFILNLLHLLNDGYKASLLLLLPFVVKEFGINLTQVGLLGSAVNILEIFLALPAGYLAIKLGGMKTLIVALVLYATGYLLSSFAPAYIVFILAFLIAGSGFGLFHPVSFSLVANMFEKKERGKQIGNFTAMGDVGRIGLSSLITFIIAYLGWRKTSFIYFLILIPLFVFFMQYIKKNKDNILSEIKEKDVLSYYEILKNKKFIFATLSYTIDTFASNSLFVFIPFLLLERGVTPTFLGIITSTFFLGNIFGKMLLGRLADRYKNTTVFIFSELAMALFILILSNSTPLILIIFASITLGIFTKGTVPVLTSMLSESVEKHGRYEKAFGLNALITGFASTLAPLALGLLADRFGIVMAFNISALFAVLAVLPALLFRRNVV